MYSPGKRFISLVVANAAITCSVSFAPRATAESAIEIPHVSAALSAPLKAAEHALNAKNYPDVIAKLREAEANPSKTSYDEHVINELAAFTYARMQNYPEAEKALEAQASDGFTDRAELPGIVKAVATLNYQLKNYDKAIEFGNRAIQIGYADDDQLYTLVAQGYYLEGRRDAVRDFLGKRIESLEVQHRNVPRPYVALVISSCLELHDSACVTAYSRRLNGPREPILIDPIFGRDAMLQANAGSE
jgi:tetratricopeptide (TPR) repeat protein